MIAPLIDIVFVLDKKKGRTFCFAFFYPFVDDWQKGGERFREFYMHICVFAYIEFYMHNCILHIMSFMFIRKWFESFKQGKKVFRTCLCFMHIYALSCLVFFAYLFVYWDAWVKGELPWSLTLIHAYITTWVLSSSKRGRLLAQRPSTLVLMMINSCSYVY